jgi:RNA polymerase primary sigma factor
VSRHPYLHLHLDRVVRGRRSIEEKTLQRSKDHEALAPYIDAIRRYPVLARDEERALALRVRSGDRAAKQKLIRHNLALVVSMARRQRRGAVPLEDVIQEGNLGLMRAVEKFDPGVGTRFSTYATWWIRAYVGRYLKEARSAVRPRAGTVAQPDLSLDAPIGDELDDVTRVERIEDREPDPEERCVSSSSDRRIRESLSRIRGRVGPLGWDIIHNRLNLDPPQTLEQIGRRWGVSRERVRQVEGETKRFLHRYLGAA